MATKIESKAKTYSLSNVGKQENQRKVHKAILSTNVFRHYLRTKTLISKSAYQKYEIFLLFVSISKIQKERKCECKQLGMKIIKMHVFRDDVFLTGPI